MLVILKRYVRTVPCGRVPKSCRMTGGGVSELPVKKLLGHGISFSGHSWGGNGRTTSSKGSSVRVSLLIVRGSSGPPNRGTNGVPNWVGQTGGRGSGRSGKLFR